MMKIQLGVRSGNTKRTEPKEEILSQSHQMSALAVFGHQPTESTKNGNCFPTHKDSPAWFKSIVNLNQKLFFAT